MEELNDSWHRDSAVVQGQTEGVSMGTAGLAVTELHRVAFVAFGPVLKPNNGMAVRDRSTVENLAGIAISVSVLSAGAPEGGTIRAGNHVVTVTGLRRRLWYGWSLELAKEVRRLCGSVDAIVVASAMLLPAVFAAHPKVPIIWDTNECETLHYSRLPRSTSNVCRGAIWRVLEWWACRAADIVVVVSDRHAEWWRSFFPSCSDLSEPQIGLARTRTNNSVGPGSRYSRGPAQSAHPLWSVVRERR
jgi:hypothetical protein